MKEITTSSLNKLGERLRNNKYSVDDMISLNEYRHSFITYYAKFHIEIKSILRQVLKEDDYSFSNRQTKTVQSIIHKLCRDKTRLSKMQDIVGCRIVINDFVTRDFILSEIKKAGFNITKEDFRDNKVGYRALHIIVMIENKPIEIQIRTSLQDFWANFCEKYSSSNNELKYGVRDEKIQQILKDYSDQIDFLEKLGLQTNNIIKSKKKVVWFLFKNKLYQQIKHIEKETHTMKEILKDDLKIIKK